ncbi:MAG: LysM peptidoglycan-binding domain-containing protein [Gemmatimonadetes bacterium]|nr:LysM peptidoglycan-binding domain-containing protein [Gemmatimonadota bacterium]
MYLHGLIALALAAASPEPSPQAQQPVTPAAPADTVPVAASATATPERWRTPFAVESTGQAVSREPRMAPVHADPPPPKAEPADSASAEQADTAADSTAAAKPARSDTIASTATAAQPKKEPARTAARTHEVAPGQTLTQIARRYGVTVAALRAANPGVKEESPKRGTTLHIPTAPAAKPKPAPADSTARKAPAVRADSTTKRGIPIPRSDSIARRGTTPPKSGSATPARTTTGSVLPTSPTASSGTRKHRVVTGDTLFGISRRYGVSPAAIRLANHMTSDEVRLGDTLVIPGK